MAVAITNWISDRIDDVSFWLRKDVSFMFKILNAVSGDRLRLYVAFACMRADALRDEYERIVKKANDMTQSMTREEYNARLGFLDYYITDIEKEVNDLFKI